MTHAIKVVLATSLLFLAIVSAKANPDVWVKADIIYQFEDGKLTGFKFNWRFDEYFSSRSIQTYDADQSGKLEPAEVDHLRAEAFDPLAQFDYYVHLWVGREKREELIIEDFAASIDSPNLVYQFSVALTPPIDPKTDTIIISLHDANSVVDFRFFKENYLLIEGTLNPACRFRLGRGKGAQSGHPQPVTLICGA